MSKNERAESITPESHSEPTFFSGDKIVEDDSEHRKNSRSLLTRRRLIQLFVGGTVAALAYPKVREFFNASSKELVENSYISLGNPEQVSYAEFGMKWLPDGHLPFVTFPDGEKVFFLSATARSFAMTENNGELVPRDLNPFGLAQPCIEPDRNEAYCNGYRSITSVFQLDENNPEHLTAITHNEQWTEQHNGANYTGSIGLAESLDRGKTWHDTRQALSAADALEPGTKVTGVGQPCAFIKEDNGKKYLHVMYLYLPADGAYLIHQSRAQIKDAAVEEFEHWNGMEFASGEIIPSNVAPVITPPAEIGDSYTALPSVAHYKDRYIAVFETQQGFCITSSTDGINWQEGEIIFRFPQGQYPHEIGHRWYSNPTLWSLDQDNDQELSQRGQMIYSTGVWDKPHLMERRNFTFKF